MHFIRSVALFMELARLLSAFVDLLRLAFL